MEGVTVCGHHPECRVTFGRGGPHIVQKSGDKTSSGEIGLDIRTHASPKVGQDKGLDE